MGTKAELLARVEDMDDAGQYDAQKQLDDARATSDTTRKSLVTLAGNLGLRGASADAAYERFCELTSRVSAVSERIAQIRSAGAEALTAVQEARDRYAELPDTTLTEGDRAAVRQQCRPDMFGQSISTVTAELGLVQQKLAAREAEAAKVLDALGVRLSGVVLPDAATYDPSADHDPFTGPGTSGSGGSDRSTRSAGGGSTGSGCSTSGAVSTGGGTSSTAQTPAFPDSTDGSPTGVLGDGSASFGSTGGSGTNTGSVHTPGHGDGSSSDGSIVGTLPGIGTSGGGGGGGWGGSSGAGSTLGGVGAGGLAGGLMVGGAALGAGRFGGVARAGVGMVGGVGGLGAAGRVGGGAGSLGGAAGGAGAGSMIGGTTSPLTQGSQTGAAGAGASGSRAGATGGMPMGGGSSGGGGQSKGTRRGSLGLRAPDLGAAEDRPVHDLGAGALAGGRDSLPMSSALVDDTDEDTW